MNILDKIENFLPFLLNLVAYNQKVMKVLQK